jgi:hypothetical protein
MKRWCIINLTDIWDAAISDPFPLNCEKLEDLRSPMVFYQDRDEAESKLFRLTEKYGEGFYLFESVGKVVRSPVDSKYYHLVKF